MLITFGFAQTNYTIEYQLENGKKVRATYRDLAWGIEDEDGNQLVPNEYGNIFIMYAPQSFIYSIMYGMVKANDITDKTDKPILPYFWLIKNGLWGLYSLEKDFYIPVVYDGIVLNYNHRSNPDNYLYYGFQVKHDGYCGYYDISGKMIMPVINQIDEMVRDKNYYIIRSGCFQGAVNLRGETIIPTEKYTKVKAMPDGNLCVKKDGKVGICDSIGNLLFMTKYTDICSEKIARDGYYTFLGRDPNYSILIHDIHGRTKSDGRIKKDGTIIKEPSLDLNNVTHRDDISSIGLKDYFIQCDESGFYGVIIRKSALYLVNMKTSPCFLQQNISVLKKMAIKV